MDTSTSWKSHSNSVPISSSSSATQYVLGCVAKLLTIHFPLVRQDDFSPSTRWIYGQGFLEALLNVGTPHSFRIGRGQVFLVLRREIAQLIINIPSRGSTFRQLTSLMSPTSRCLESPLRSAGPKGPALTGVHGDVMVPAPTTPSAREHGKTIRLGI